MAGTDRVGLPVNSRVEDTVTVDLLDELPSRIAAGAEGRAGQGQVG